ncbi:CPBP family intramembrane glutamic endopeptidase [Lysinibacillus antri]|uniref:CPBP family intramembrane metalloprotease n=1 Tax=Lysinibacillus antri TaxID=2498145 RepID=A0A432LCU9_9BACI|nr:CPBP family intramembrane glutamic endopeptidase [Lysinibacillus antri]RUL53088.1 CPBP family intramembrane metalloprotease [Lysinibacillus antri]
MLKKLSDIQKAFAFTSFTLILATAFTFLLPKNTDVGLLMFVPLFVGFMMMLFTGELFSKSGWSSLGLHKFSMKGFLIGFVTPIIPIVVGYVIVWNTGLAEFTVPAELEGNIPLLLFSFVATIVITSLTKILGEEIGWRGYLLPRLQPLGIEKALFVSSFIWGLFHIAPILFSGQYHSDTNFIIFIPLFMMNLLFVGFFIGYLRFITGSIWPAVIAHGAHNVLWGFGASFTTNTDPIVAYLTGDVGIIGVIFYFIIYLVIRKDLKKRKAIGKNI